jgi:hypothetical protein
MITTIILISILVIVPPIYNHKISKLAHYNVDGRWYGLPYTLGDKIVNSLPAVSIIVLVLFLNRGWRRKY